MKKIIYMLITFISFSACSNLENMTDKEISLINNGSIDTPYRVLQTDNKEDSLFLRQNSIDLDINSITNDKELPFFIERLKLTLAVESGVGIAAPQVGIGRNLFLFMRIDKPEMPVEVAINPKIVNHPDDIFCFEGDGCLSVPGLSGVSKRYEWIDVEYFNEKGELIKERLSGNSRRGDFTGIIFQHEFDHLQGVLFIDKLCK